MKSSLLPAAILLVAAILPAEGEILSPAPPESTAGSPSSPHLAMARELVDILSRTEAALQTCRDAESVKTSLPVLREQRKRMHEAAARQSRLPDAGKEEQRIVNAQYADLFSSLADAISDHMRRLEEAGLATPEFKEVMQTPGTAPKR